MPSIITIGEYADPTQQQREFLRESELDLSSGAAELILSDKTRSIRVGGTVAHRWRLGKDGRAGPGSQRRAAGASEALDVMPGQGWVFSAVAEEGASGGAESDVAAFLDLLGNKAKYEKALKGFTEAREAAEKAARDAKASLKELAAKEADLSKREASVASTLGRIAAREAAVADGEKALEAKRQAFVAEEAAAAQRNSDRNAALDARERALKPKELTLGRREAALARKEEQAAEAYARAEALKAEYEKKLSSLRALAS